jgi:hypothetical protein
MTMVICDTINGTRHCHEIPDAINRYWPWEPPESLVARGLWNVGQLLIRVAKPQPDPWREARMSDVAKRDLSVLSTIHSLADVLSPALRSPIQDSAVRQVEQIQLPEGASIQGLAVAGGAPAALVG